jgi:serine/threonine protein kinase
MGEPAAGDLFAGHRIEALIGRGGMGVVFRAREEASGERVALKVVAPEMAEDSYFRARFQREMRLAREFEHPNAVAVRGSGEFEGALWIAMRFVAGIDLEALLAERTCLHPRHAAAICAQVASALDAAHQRGFIHRDVKPGNVLLERTGAGEAHALLGDFGLSKHVASQSGITRAGHWVGTVDYASPEQLDARETDARTDVYALGAVLHEMLTGLVPYPRPTDVQVMSAHLSEPPPRVSDEAPAIVPAAFDEVVMRAMAKEPDERFRCAGDLGRAAAMAAAEAPEPEEPLLAPAVERPSAPPGARTVG